MLSWYAHDAGGEVIVPGSHRGLEVTSHLRDRWRFDEAGDGDLDVQGIVDAGEEVCGQEGVSTRGKEVVMDPHVLDIEDLGPQVSEHLLERCAWCHERLWRDGRAGESELRRQSVTLHFTRRTPGELRDDTQMARN